MASITIRDIPDSVLDKIRIRSKRNRRSMNSELITLLENALEEADRGERGRSAISPETQIELWRMLGGKWLDSRTTEEIIDDIYSRRTEGRDVDL